MNHLSTDTLILKFKLDKIVGQLFLYHLGTIAPTIAISLFNLIQKDERILDAIPLFAVMIDSFRYYYSELNYSSDFISYIDQLFSEEEPEEVMGISSPK